MIKFAWNYIKWKILIGIIITIIIIIAQII